MTVNLLLLVLLVPLLTAALGALPAPRRVKDIILLGGLSPTFALCLAIAGEFLSGVTPTAFGEVLRVDALSALVVVLSGFVGLLSAAYGVGYMRRNAARDVSAGMRREFDVLTPAYVFAMLLVAVSNNLGILWIAVELTTQADDAFAKHQTWFKATARVAFAVVRTGAFATGTGITT